jgi:hypothetical protein
MQGSSEVQSERAVQSSDTFWPALKKYNEDRFSPVAQFVVVNTWYYLIDGQIRVVTAGSHEEAEKVREGAHRKRAC